MHLASGNSQKTGNLGCYKNLFDSPHLKLICVFNRLHKYLRLIVDNIDCLLNRVGDENFST